MPITYRKLQPNESTLYREIRMEALKNNRDSFATTYEDEMAKPKLHFERCIEEQTPNRFTAGAFEDENLIGICSFMQEERGKEQHKGWIMQMYVKPAYKGRKIGFHLLSTAVQLAFEIPAVEQLLLGVMSTNIAANRIYEQAGFVEYGFHKGYTKEEGRYVDERMMMLCRS